MVVSHPADPVIRQRLEDQLQPLPQPKSGEYLARQIDVSVHPPARPADDSNANRSGGVGVSADAADPGRYLPGAAGRWRCFIRSKSIGRVPCGDWYRPALARAI